MVLPSQRKRQAERDAAEAEGENLWTEKVPKEAWVKIGAFLTLLKADTSSMAHHIGSYLAHESGRSATSIWPHTLAQVPNELALDALGAYLVTFSHNVNLRRDCDRLRDRVNTVFEDHRVAYRVVDDELVPIESDELHNEVVAPAIALLIGEKFAAANSAYINALREVPVDPSDAITDAGTALQETLTALGCVGNALGPLVKDAKKKQLLAPHDTQLGDGIEKFLNWASADRSETGDAHKASHASRADAWLMIHIVGALIVRLADESPR